MAVGQWQEVMVITRGHKVKSTPSLHFLVQLFNIHFANCVSGEIDLSQDAAKDRAFGDSEEQVVVGQQLECGWEIALLYAGVVVPDRVSIPVCKQRLDHTRRSRSIDQVQEFYSRTFCRA